MNETQKLTIQRNAALNNINAARVFVFLYVRVCVRGPYLWSLYSMCLRMCAYYAYEVFISTCLEVYVVLPHAFCVRFICTHHTHIHVHTHVHVHRFVCYSFDTTHAQCPRNSLGFILYFSFLHPVALRILLAAFNMSLIGSNLATFLRLATCCIGKISIITFFLDSGCLVF